MLEIKHATEQSIMLPTRCRL